MFGNTGDSATTSAQTPSRPIAFVARGKIFSGGPGRPLSELHSTHVKAINDGAERSRALHAWKEETTFGIRAFGRRGSRLAQEHCGERLPSLVPATWQLVRRDGNGAERVLAKHVVAVDIAADGALLFCNGSGVFAIVDDGALEVVVRDRLVGEIAAG